jgi:release factor glutamine methyltransferase
MNLGDALQTAGLDRREARLLLAAASGIPEARFVAHPEHELDESSRSRFEAWTARRKQGEPIAYLIGWREFYGLTLAVTPAVLIPRHESELLVERALERLPVKATQSACRVLDLGTGSGALALAIKRERPSAQVRAVDASRPALAVARGNALRLGLEVDWREGHWFSAVPGECFDVIVSNPPYVALGDPHLAQGDLRFEPTAALIGGADGLAAIRDIVRDAPAHLRPGGWLFLEHGYDQADAVRACLQAANFEEITAWPDLAGHPRVSGGRSGGAR